MILLYMAIILGISCCSVGFLVFLGSEGFKVLRLPAPPAHQANTSQTLFCHPHPSGIL